MVERDTPDRIPALGYLLPGSIVLLVLLNLVLGRVYWPSNWRWTARLLDTYSDPARFWGTILFKLGMAGGIFAWFGLANYTRTEGWSIPVLMVGIGSAAIGLMLFCLGFFQ